MAGKKEKYDIDKKEKDRIDYLAERITEEIMKHEIYAESKVMGIKSWFRIYFREPAVEGLLKGDKK